MFIVGGTFDNNGGKPSYFIREMMRILGVPGINGGYLEDLSIDFSFTPILIWMPNVDNSYGKVLPEIKVKYPHMTLVQSKRITDGNYTDSDVVGRLLKSRSLLGITIEKIDTRYEFKLLDPLGNIFCKTGNIELLCNTLKDRVLELNNMTRVRSEYLGPAHKFTVDEKFIGIVKKFGYKFSKYVNAVNPNRLLGNASTRCESGFPAFKNIENRIFVSRRNVEKRTLSSDDFVEVVKGTNEVGYFGEHKPSVDTPIQLQIFEYFPNIKYIIHGHAYIKNALYTEDKIPCGCMEELADILDIVSDISTEQFAINLRGHGCIIACKDLSFFDTIKLKARPFPEE